MGGIVFVTDERRWSVSTSVFYWAIDALADLVQNQGLAAQLREVSEENLGSIDVEELSEVDRRDLGGAANRLPDVARATLPRSEEREVVIGQIERLAALLAPA